MAGRYEVRIKVISQKGRCSVGHKVGDVWVTTGKSPEGICLNAFGMLLPNVRTLMYGGEFPWETDKDTAVVCCPDVANPVVFEVRRIRK
jgi:TIGR04076 family protein